MRYDYRLSRRADHALERLHPEARRRVVRRLEQLREDPFDARWSLPLTNAAGLRRARVGDYWIVFRVDRDSHLLFIETLGPRGGAYGDRGQTAAALLPSSPLPYNPRS